MNQTILQISTMPSSVAPLSILLLLVTGLLSMDEKHVDDLAPIQNLAPGQFPIRLESYPQIKVGKWRGTNPQNKHQTYIEDSQAMKHTQTLAANTLDTRHTELENHIEINLTGTKQHASKEQQSQYMKLRYQRLTNIRDVEGSKFPERFQRHAQGSQKLERVIRLWGEMMDDGRASSNDITPSLKKRSLASGAAILVKGRPETKVSTKKAKESQRTSEAIRPISSPRSRSSPKPNSRDPRPSSKDSGPKMSQSPPDSKFSSKLKQSIKVITNPVTKVTQKLASQKSLKAGEKKNAMFEGTPRKRLTSGYAPKPSNARGIQTLEYPQQDPHIENVYAPTQEELDLLFPQSSPSKGPEIQGYWDYIGRHSKNWEERSYREDQNFVQTHGHPPPLGPNQTQQSGPHGHQSVPKKSPSPRTNTLNPQHLSRQLDMSEEKHEIQNFITKKQEGWAKFYKSPPREENTQVPPAATETAKKPPAKSYSESSPTASDDESHAESGKNSPDQSACHPVRLLNSIASTNQLPSVKHPNPQPPLKKLSNKLINERYDALSNRVRSADKPGKRVTDPR